MRNEYQEYPAVKRTKVRTNRDKVICPNCGGNPELVYVEHIGGRCDCRNTVDVTLAYECDCLPGDEVMEMAIVGRNMFWIG